jgi:hypothetical protein
VLSFREDIAKLQTRKTKSHDEGESDRIYQRQYPKNWDINSMSDYKGESLTFKEVGTRIARLHCLFDAFGLKRGDKVALIGKLGQLGRNLSGHYHLWRRYRSNFARFQAQRCAPHYQPLRICADVCCR